MSDVETRDGRWAIRRQKTEDERYGDKRRKMGHTKTRDER